MATSTFGFTGAPATFVVPAGVSTIGVDGRGACGGCDPGSTSESTHAGRGTRWQGYLDVIPGETLTIQVGGFSEFGASYPDGGLRGFGGLAALGGYSGGGSTRIWRGGVGGTLIAILAAGGGDSPAGWGGPFNIPRGDGGTPSPGGTADDLTYASPTTYSGRGATDTAGGAAGTPGASTAGTALQGGNGAPLANFYRCGSSGGGGGYFGGGGGGAQHVNNSTYPRLAAGGGGSSYVDPSCTTTAWSLAEFTAVSATRHGELIFTWTVELYMPLTVSKTGTGGGLLTTSPAGLACGSTCSANFDNGTWVTVHATPDWGSEFVGWTGDGDGDFEDRLVRLNTTRSMTAEFALVAGGATKGFYLGNIIHSPAGAELPPCTPGLTVVGSVTDTRLNGASSLAFAGGFCYVPARIADRFNVVDVSTPTDPVIVGSQTSTLLNGADGVLFDPATMLCYVPYNNDAVAKVNVAVPTAPGVVAGHSGVTDLFGGRSMILEGDLLYVAVGGGLVIVDVDTFASVRGSVLVAEGTAENGRVPIKLGNLVYVSFTYQGIITFDVTSTTTPTVDSTFLTPSLQGASGMVYDGGLFYVVHDGGLSVVDMTVPEIIGNVTDAALTGGAGLVKEGDLCYACGGSWVTIVDVSNPADPQIHDTITHAALNGAIAIAKSGANLYVAAQSADAVTVLDVGCP